MELTSAVLSAIAQTPTVIVLLYIMVQQNKAHQQAIEYYRQQHGVILTWIMQRCDNPETPLEPPQFTGPKPTP